MQRLYFAIFILLLSSITLSAQSNIAVQNCIAIMGDSLPAGTFVAQIPGTGVTVLQSRRISQILDDALQARDMIHYGIYDLSLAASAITDPEAEPYLTSREYFLGRGLNCRYTVIFPFVNDLYSSDDGSTGVDIYRAGITNMLNGIRSNSPNSRIILMNFYATTLQGLGADTYGGDVTAVHVQRMNSIHNSICEADTYITCLPLGQVLDPISDYVVGGISQSDYRTFSYAVVNAADQTMLTSYWANTPNNLIYGDGLHLNADAKVRLVATLMGLFTQIDPINFAPILQ